MEKGKSVPFPNIAVHLKLLARSLGAKTLCLIGNALLIRLPIKLGMAVDKQYKMLQLFQGEMSDNYQGAHMQGMSKLFHQ